MHNLSDDELDRLSREAADQHMMPAGEAAWDRIYARLEKEMPSGPGFNYHVIPDLALLLLLFIGLPVFYSAPGKQPAINIQQQVKTNSGESVTAEVEKKLSSEKEDESATASVKKAAEPSRKSQPSVPGSADAVYPSAGTEIRKAGEIVKQEGGTGNPPAEKKRNNTVQSTVVSEKYKSPASGKMATGRGTNDGPDIVNSGSERIDETNKITYRRWYPEYPESNAGLHASAGLVVTGKLQTPIPDPSPSPELKAAIDQYSADEKIKAKKNQDQRTNLLEFGIVWSPDFSRVGSGAVGTMGNIAGFVAAYNFNKRWSVNTGILYSNKNYQSVENGYNNIPGYPAYDPFVKIKKVQAECLMWDLPINVRYNFYWRPKQRAFASTGLSSYFMKQEDLKYWYTYYNNPRYKEWVNENGSNYWFAVLNLSGGFEQQIFEGFTVQAEPFVKLSMRDIGYGKINLKSYGVFLGLKYIPPIHRIKK